MLIESPINAEIVCSVTQHTKRSWKIQDLAIDIDCDPSEAKIHFSNSVRKTLSLAMSSARLTVYNSFIEEGKLTVRLVTPWTTYNLFLNDAKPNELRMLNDYLGQFLPGATSEAKKTAKRACDLYYALKAKAKADQLSALKRRLGPEADEIDLENRRRGGARAKDFASESRVRLNRQALETIQLNSAAHSGAEVARAKGVLGAKPAAAALPSFLEDLLGDAPMPALEAAPDVPDARERGRRDDYNYSTGSPSRSLAEQRVPAATLDQLSPSQRRVLDMVLAGSSVFFTGPAGCGKSFLLSILKAALPASTTHFTATTGIVAVSMGGATVWHWLGANLSDDAPRPGFRGGAGGGAAPQDPVRAAVDKVNRNPHLRQRLRAAKTLVIDEISMLSCGGFDRIDRLLRAVRGGIAPFGGLQIVCCGDFFQLPPVTRADDAGDKFAFEARAWQQLFTPARVVLLERVFRQHDSSFVGLLNRVRVGDASGTQEALADAVERGRVIAALGSAGSGPHEYAEKVRERQLRLDDGDERGAADITLPAVSSRLDVGAVAAAFSDATWLLTRKHEVDRLNTERLGRLSGDPVTLRAVDQAQQPHFLEQLRRASPARDSMTLKVGALVLLTKNLNVHEGLCNGTRGVVLRFTREQLPVVFFPSTKKTLTMGFEKFPIVVGGSVVAERAMVPLELAWGISVHKSQGMTLDKAIIDISNTFEHGQTYVALSRMRSLEGLALVGFKAAAVRAHPLVQEFYDKLGEAHE